MTTSLNLSEKILMRKNWDCPFMTSRTFKGEGGSSTQTDSKKGAPPPGTPCFTNSDVWNVGIDYNYENFFDKWTAPFGIIAYISFEHISTLSLCCQIYKTLVLCTELNFCDLWPARSHYFNVILCVDIHVKVRHFASYLKS